MVENEELFIEAKAFFNISKKEIGNAIRKGKNLITLDFSKLTATSPVLAETLLNSPAKVIEILKTSLEETGLIKRPEFNLINIPELNKKTVSELRICDLGKLLEVKGRILKRDKIRHKIVSVKFECPSCGTIISVLQLTDKIHEPSKCSCGRSSKFRWVSRGIEDFLKIILQDGKTDDLVESEFRGGLIDEFRDIIMEGNVVSITGILRDKVQNKNTEIAFDLEPYGLRLIELTKENPNNIEEYLLALKKAGNEGPFIFEQYIGKLFEKKGYRVQVTKKTGDFGTDVIAENDTERIAIQCKLVDKYAKTPNTAIQKALGSLVSPYEANKLIFITTAEEFTTNAKEQASKCKVPVELWNRERLIAEIKSGMYDLEEGWELLDKSKEINPEPGREPSTINRFDIDKFTTSTSSIQRSKILLVRGTIEKLEEKYGKMIPLEELRKELGNSVSDIEFQESIETLKRKGDIFSPKTGYVHLIL